MNTPSNLVGILSEQDLFDWLKIKPRTLEWDALVVYDRLKANQLLLSEYIGRFTGESYFKPFTAQVLISEGETRTWEYLFDQVLDAPRLSFENSDIGDSLARFTMQILGGVQMSVEQPPNAPKRVTKVEWFDPLQGPKLVAGIRLEDTDGSVSEDGRVKLDLSKGMDFELTFASTYHARTEGGKIYKQLFESLEDHEKVFVLNTLESFDEGEYLDPEKFRIRAFPAIPSRSEGELASQHGDILVLVAGKGSPSGHLPDEDMEWVYPIPAGRSSTVLFSNSVLMRKLIAMGMKYSPYTFSESFVIDDDGQDGVSLMTVTAGVSRFPSREVIASPVLGRVSVSADLSLFDAVSEVAAGNEDGDDYRGWAEFFVKRVGERITFSWRGDSRTYVVGAYLRGWSDGGEGGGIGTFRVLWDVERSYEFSISESGGAHLSKPSLVTDDVELVVSGIAEEFADRRDEVVAAATKGVREYIDDYFRTFIEATGEIDLFRLHALLFRGDQVVQLRSARLPCDLALFGDLSPEHQRFSISPLEVVVAAGAEHQVVVQPPQQDVRWSVERVPGFLGSIGSITPGGLYTAPEAKDMFGVFTMVRITAKVDEYVSSALVRVVTRSVMLNPLVVSASLNGGKVKLAGGTLGDGPLEWELSSQTGAELTQVPPDNGVEFGEEDHFYVPGSTPSGQTFSVDEVTVTNSALGSTATSYVIVIESSVNATIWIKDDPALPEGQVQLELDGGMGALPDVTWTVLAGGGSITADGLFTADPASPHPFAVISSEYKLPPIAHFRSYLILPIPLVDLEDVKRALR